LSCAPATGGLIIKGLVGYLGDGADPNATRDVAAAQALLRSWDPAGTRRSSLRMGSFSSFRAMATEIKAEWQSVLGIDVQLEIGEFETIRGNASRGLYDIIIGAYRVDYDSPHNWFDNLPGACSVAKVNPEFMSLVAAADKKRPDDAVGDYKKALQLLGNDAVCSAIAYQQSVQLIKPWIRGAGANALYEYYWTSISIIKH